MSHCLNGPSTTSSSATTSVSAGVPAANGSGSSNRATASPAGGRSAGRSARGAGPAPMPGTLYVTAKGSSATGGISGGGGSGWRCWSICSPCCARVLFGLMVSTFSRQIRWFSTVSTTALSHSQAFSFISSSSVARVRSSCASARRPAFRAATPSRIRSLTSDIAILLPSPQTGLQHRQRPSLEPPAAFMIPHTRPTTPGVAARRAMSVLP